MTDDRSGSELRPLVGVVVVNFHGDDRTEACLDALAATTWPADRLRVVVVDNGSAPEFSDRVRTRPGVRYLPAGSNLGFPGGCNLGIDALIDSCEFIGLVNNDALPDPGWLEPLVRELQTDPHIGGATPRLLLAGRFVRFTVAAPTRRAGGGDLRDLGAQLSGVRIGRQVVTDALELGDGFWGWETGEPAGRFAWTGDRAVALVRLSGDDRQAVVGPLELRLSCVLGPTQVSVDAGGHPAAIAIDSQPRWELVDEQVRVVHLVNSTGIVLHPDGSCGDRDYFALEDEVLSTEAETFACSGAAALFRSAFLKDVGSMDERFFLYYEDVDLCWRGRLRGWRFRYVPESVVVHEHSATVGSGSPLAAHLAARNRLLTLTKVAPRSFAAVALRTTLGSLGRTAWNDVFRAVLRRQRPEPDHAVATTRVLLGYVRLVPHALVERRRLGRRSTVDRRSAMQVA